WAGGRRPRRRPGRGRAACARTPRRTAGCQRPPRGGPGRASGGGRGGSGGGGGGGRAGGRAAVAQHAHVLLGEQRVASDPAEQGRVDLGGQAVVVKEGGQQAGGVGVAQGAE